MKTKEKSMSTKIYKKYDTLDVNSYFDKENILISQRYQLHIISATTQYPNGNKMHTPKKGMS
jgi:hypothetical protein